jgi:hypothetical protein
VEGPSDFILHSDAFLIVRQIIPLIKQSCPCS